MSANTPKCLRRIRAQSLTLSDERDPIKPDILAVPPSRAEASRTRSLSLPRRKVYDWEEFCRIDEVDEDNLDDKSVATWKNPRRWRVTEFLYRSISEGRGRAREKEMERERLVQAALRAQKMKKPTSNNVGGYNSRKLGGRSAATSNKLSAAATSKGSATPPRSTAGSASKEQRRDAVSAHERYYSANRARSQAQVAELKKKTFLPYRQGLLGWLGPFHNSNSGNNHALFSAC